jgi:hypothetical protein
MLLVEHASNRGVWYLMGPHSAILLTAHERRACEDMGVPVADARIPTSLVNKLRLDGESER